jgi:putative SOS response-associated peptidase YedK
MCGLFTLRRRATFKRVRREFRAETGASHILWEPRYNIAPTNRVPVPVRTETGARLLQIMAWASRGSAVAGWSAR